VEPRATEPEAFPPPSLTQRVAASGEPEVEAGTGRRYLIADVDPLDVTGVRTVMVGTAIFVVALLALLPFTDELRDEGRLWWLWTCGAGIGLGLFGIHYCRRRAAALAARSRPEAGPTAPTGPAQV
jgi:hypothetical protein